MKERPQGIPDIDFNEIETLADLERYPNLPKHIREKLRQNIEARMYQIRRIEVVMPVESVASPPPPNRSMFAWKLLDDKLRRN